MYAFHFLKIIATLFFQEKHCLTKKYMCVCFTHSNKIKYDRLSFQNGHYRICKNIPFKSISYNFQEKAKHLKKIVITSYRIYTDICEYYLHSVREGDSNDKRN